MVVVMFIVPAMNTQTSAGYTRWGIMWYDERRAEASKGDLARAAQSLNSVMEYRPTKVPTTGDFAQILDTFRASAVREIIARMRTLSGEDLGDDPNAWIHKYYKRDPSLPNEQGGANGEQPGRSQTNQAPAAAAPRRSP